MSRLPSRTACFYCLFFLINRHHLWSVLGDVFSRPKEKHIYYKEQLVRLNKTNEMNHVESYGFLTSKDLLSKDRTRRSLKDLDPRHLNTTSAKNVQVTSWILTGDGNMNAIVYWTGKDSKIMFILSCQEVNATKDREGRSACISPANIYRSDDYGTTFTKENSKFSPHALLHAVYFSGVDAKFLIVTDVHNKKLYISKDLGVSYDDIIVPFEPVTLTYHPMYSEYILGYSPYSQSLYISTTTGANWTKVCNHNILRYYWAVPGVDVDMTKIYLEADHIPFIKVVPHHLSTFYVAKMPYNGNVQSFSLNVGLIVRNSLFIEKEFILIQKEGNERKLFVSYNRRDFVECHFPTTDGVTHYYVADASEDEIILAILHQTHTNLYISDQTGQWFTLALSDLLTSDFNTWQQQFPMVDVHLVEGLRGTYLANKIGKGTLITYDKGGSWHYLKAPEYDHAGKKTNCHLPSCSLHLQLYVRRLRSVFGITPILSKQSAPGLILAQGVLGMSDPRSGEISVYTSRDGGLTWSQAIDKPFGFVLIDHGSVIVTAPLRRHANVETNKLRYSCTEGMSWRAVAISSEVIQIIGLLTESAAESSIVTIFGRYSTWKKFEWSIWRLNFSDALDFKCTRDNYTFWSPTSDKHSNRSCILGESLRFERRKPDACCLNGLNFRRPVNITKCECGLDDFECDFGFARKERSNECVASTPSPNVRPFPCPEGKTYLETRGYRKIIGDKCVNGIETKLQPVERSCPPQPPNGFSLSVSKHSVAVSEAVVFKFSQRRGFLNTLYSWKFGDNISDINIRNYEDARLKTHAYSKVGEYPVQLSAVNDAGSYTISTTIFVINKVLRAYLRCCTPTVVMEPCKFHLIVDPSVATNPKTHGFIHFAWIFNPKERPRLTFSPYLEHSFKTSGSYDVEVQVINPVGVLSVAEAVTVYDRVKEIQLEFSSAIDMLNDESEGWAKKFSQNLHFFLIKRYHLDKDRLIVITPPSIPTHSSVYVVQRTVVGSPFNKTFEEREMDNIVNAIVEDLKEKQARIYLKGNSYRILSAEVVNRKDKRDLVQVGAKHYFGLQIGLPIALGVSFLAFVLLIYHYHNKCFPGRYRFIRQSTSSQLLDFGSLNGSSVSDLSLLPES